MIHNRHKTPDKRLNAYWIPDYDIRGQAPEGKKVVPL